MSVMLGFSAIARSVMISAVVVANSFVSQTPCFSAIARSVMISAVRRFAFLCAANSFSAIARSVMISASTQIPRSVFDRSQFQCYSS